MGCTTTSPPIENSINNVEQPRAKQNFNAAYEELLDGPCLIHKNSKHTMQQCHGMAKPFHDEEQKRQRHEDNESDDGRGEECPKYAQPAFQDANKTIATIFGGYVASKSKRQQKLTARQVMSITKYDMVTDPKYLD